MCCHRGFSILVFFRPPNVFVSLKIKKKIALTFVDLHINTRSYRKMSADTKQVSNEKIEETLDALTTNWNERVETFDTMNLKEELLRGIYSYGFEKPSLIQQKAIMPLIR